MRAVYLFLAAFFVSPTVLAADKCGEVTGGMSCEITSSATVKSEEGKPKALDLLSPNYGNFIPPILTLNLTYTDNPMGFDFKLDSYGYMKRANYLYNYPDYPLDLEKISTLGRIEYAAPHTFVSFDPDNIWVKAMGDELKLERYYKGDWHGTLSVSPPFELALQIVTLDCRTTKDAIEEVIASFQMRALAEPQ